MFLEEQVSCQKNAYQTVFYLSQVKHKLSAHAPFICRSGVSIHLPLKVFPTFNPKKNMASNIPWHGGRRIARALEGQSTVIAEAGRWDDVIGWEDGHGWR